MSEKISFVEKHYNRIHDCDTYTYRTESGDYTIHVSFFRDSKTGEPDFDLCRNVSFVPVKTSMPFYHGVGKICPVGGVISDTNSCSFIGYSLSFGTPFNDVNELSDPKFWRAKQVAMDFDEVVRRDFPGYCLLYREGDVMQEDLYSAIADKLLDYYDKTSD